MTDFLGRIDRALFDLINHRWHSDFSDTIMPLLRQKENWIPLYLLLLFIVVKQFKKQSWIIIITAILCLGAADTISSKVIKPYFQRDRPCNDIVFKKDVRLLVSCGSGYSFPSSHAANHAALAFFLVFLPISRLKSIKAGWMLWAFSIAYAQVYVGVHYPLDIITGFVLGAFLGWLFSFVANTLINKFHAGTLV